MLDNKGPFRRKLKQSSDGPPEKHRKVLDDAVKFTSINRSFRTKNYTAATYHQAKQGLSYFDSKRFAEDDRIHAHPLNL